MFLDLGDEIINKVVSPRNRFVSFRHSRSPQHKYSQLGPINKKRAKRLILLGRTPGNNVVLASFRQKENCFGFHAVPVRLHLLVWSNFNPKISLDAPCKNLQFASAMIHGRCNCKSALRRKIASAGLWWLYFACK